ncbi:hypothetical protein PR048_019754 [Dryococelus australis]|uniref:Uncharacterized protein n=1 Tax=Dryococelus australis TaxID=614101 RepID=A0ABQ9H4D1_9NEOP|nr:hypothetical protein PR048_019754 [Dryococelus australis]
MQDSWFSSGNINTSPRHAARHSHPSRPSLVITSFLLQDIMKASQILCTLVAIAVLESACSACLVTNCPKGGKRSLGHGKDTLRQVPRSVDRIHIPRGGQEKNMAAMSAMPEEDWFCDKARIVFQCPRCGPAKTGHCYGADICCGVEMGCAMATVDTLVCQREQMSPEPCVGPTGHVPCGRNGKCAAPGVCCTPGTYILAAYQVLYAEGISESCTIDPSCHQALSQEMVNLFMYEVGNMRGAGQLSDVDDK